MCPSRVYIFSIGFFVDNLRLLLLDLVNDAAGTQGCRGVKILFQPFRLNSTWSGLLSQPS